MCQIKIIVQGDFVYIQEARDRNETSIVKRDKKRTIISLSTTGQREAMPEKYISRCCFQTLGF